MLEANDMVEAKLAEIRERKIYEMKRMFAAKMHEGVGGLTKAEVEARKKAGYKKASDVLGDPRKEMTPIAGHQFKKVKKKISEETLDEAGLAPSTKRAKLYKLGLQAIRGYERRKQAKAAAKASGSSEDKPDSYLKRVGKRISDDLDKKSEKYTTDSGKSAWERSVGGKIERGVRRFANSPITQDVKDIAFRNI